MSGATLSQRCRDAGDAYFMAMEALGHDVGIELRCTLRQPVEREQVLDAFEALLRGLKVVCWGAPFYAGWGLTEDRVALPRRQARPDLDTLVAGALIAYPRYVDPVSGVPCSAEEAVELQIGRAHV